jgi:NDP-sugar pyrophosphorylase family protein
LSLNVAFGSRLTAIKPMPSPFHNIGVITLEKLPCTSAARRRLGGTSAPFLSPNGAYVFDRRALEHIADKGFQDIKEALIPKLHAAGEQVAFLECKGRSPRIFDAESYLSVNRWAISRLSDPNMAADLATKGYHAHGEGFVHESSRVSPRARLVGPLVVGPGATVEADAILVGPVAIGGASLVAEGAVASRSVVWGHCRLGRESLVDGCLVSDGAHVPAGASRYRVLETGRPRAGEESPLRVSAWALSRVREWVEFIASGRPAGPPPQPAAGHLRGDNSRHDRLVALGRSRS